MERKIVKPAHVGGRIWNPDHNSFLPADGAEVLMTPYWLSLVERGDVIAAELPSEPALA